MAPRLSLAHARTQRSFETLYHEHVTDVYRYALAVTGQASDAEDVTQTTFMNAYRAYARGERPRKPQNWLLTIAHNVCRQRARLGYYRVREVELEESAQAAFMPPEDVPSAADIKRALAHLPFQQRAVLIMRELEGRSHAEIAEVMGLTTPATEMLAFRARRALREHLADSLTCTQATTALDQQAAGTLDNDSAGLLRAHLRECPDCDRLARRMRAQQSALKDLVVVPLPSALFAFDHASIVAGGSTAAGGGFGAVMAKFVAASIAGATIGGGAYFVKRDVPPLHPHRAQARAAHVHRHATTHAVAAAASWDAGPTTGTRAVTRTTPIPHTAAKKHAKQSEPIPVVTVPAVPTGAATLPTPTDDQPPAPTDQPVEPDGTAQTDQPTQSDPQPQPGDPAQQQDPPPPVQQHDNGVRSHGSPTPPAEPNGDGPQGKSNATPPPYSSGG